MPAQLSVQEVVFGVEIESFVDNSKYAELIIDLETIGCNHTEDGSIQPPSGTIGVEIQTPPYPYTKFVNEFIPALSQVLKKHNVRANTSCGLHVHASHPNFFKKMFLNRINLAWIGMEDIFFALQNPNRMYNSFCTRKWFDYVQRGGLPKFGDTKLSLLRGINTNRDALNIGALKKHGTIECRTHTGTTNPTIIRNWIYLLNQFYNYCLKNYRKQEIKDFITSKCNMKKVTRAWDVLALDKISRKHFSSHIKPQLFSRLNRQTERAKKGVSMSYKIKWYESKFGFDQATSSPYYDSLPSSYPYHPFSRSQRRNFNFPYPISVLGKEVGKTKGYKNYLKIIEKRSKILNKMVEHE